MLQDTEWQVNHSKKLVSDLQEWALQCIKANPQACMLSSAQLCYDDSIALSAKGNYVYSYARAMKSAAYTVGIMHSGYQTALRLQDQVKN